MADIASLPTSVKGTTIRLTRLDDCGIRVAEGAANSRITTDAFVMAEFTPDYSSSSEIDLKNADGKVLAYEAAENLVRGSKVKLKLGGVPRHALEMMIGAELLTDTVGGTGVRGFVYPGGSTIPKKLMIEIWSRTVAGQECLPGQSFPFFYWCAPNVSKWMQTSAISWSESGAAEFEFEGFGVSSPSFEPSIAAEWPDLTWRTQVRRGGPLVNFTVPSLPAVPVGAGYD